MTYGKCAHYPQESAHFLLIQCLSHSRHACKNRRLHCFHLPEKPAQQFVKIQAKLDAIHVLTKEEYTVWWLQYTPFSFLFVFLFQSLHDSFRDRGGRGVALRPNLCRKGVGLRLPSHATRSYMFRHTFLPQVRGRKRVRITASISTSLLM